VPSCEHNLTHEIFCGCVLEARLLPTHPPTFNAKLAAKSNSKLGYMRETRLFASARAAAAGRFPHIIEIANLPTFSRPSLHYSLSFSLSYFYIWKRLAGWQHARRARARRGPQGQPTFWFHVGKVGRAMTKIGFQSRAPAANTFGWAGRFGPFSLVCAPVARVQSERTDATHPE
jgi:hypothetical protein